MKKKYIIISIYIVTIILIALLVLLLTNNNKKKDIGTTTTTIVDNNTTEETPTTTTVTTTEVTTSTVSTTERNTTTTTTTKKVVTNNNNNNSNNNNNNTQPATNPPQKRLTCPDGYDLNGDKCTTIVAANQICPTGYWPYAGDLCIDPNDNSMVINQGDPCPDGSAPLAESHLDGKPTVYYCKRTTAKKWGCDNGFTFNNNDKTCSRTINATWQ